MSNKIWNPVTGRMIKESTSIGKVLLHFRCPKEAEEKVPARPSWWKNALNHLQTAHIAQHENVFGIFLKRYKGSTEIIFELYGDGFLSDFVYSPNVDNLSSIDDMFDKRHVISFDVNFEKPFASLKTFASLCPRSNTSDKQHFVDQIQVLQSVYETLDDGIEDNNIFFQNTLGTAQLQFILRNGFKRVYQQELKLQSSKRRCMGAM